MRRLILRLWLISLAVASSIMALLSRDHQQKVGSAEVQRDVCHAIGSARNSVLVIGGSILCFGLVFMMVSRRRATRPEQQHDLWNGSGRDAGANRPRPIEPICHSSLFRLRRSAERRKTIAIRSCPDLSIRT